MPRLRALEASASTILSLAAGLLTVAAVASAWVPLVHQADAIATAHMDERLKLVAVLASEEINREQGMAAPAPGADWRPPTAVARRLERLLSLPPVELVALLAPDGTPLLGVLAEGSLVPRALADLARACAEDPPPAVEAAGRRYQAACAPLTDLADRPAGFLVVAAPADTGGLSRAGLLRASGLMVALGALAGLLVILGTRWLLGPVHELAGAARRIAAGERGVRVEPRGPEEIAQLGRAVNALSSSIAAREDEIHSRMNVVTQLSSMVAHEVRNPLQSLSLLCSLARTEEDPEVRDKLLADIDSEIHVLEGVVQRFLRNSGPLQISRAPVDLVELVRRATAVAEPEARSRSVTLMVHAPARFETRADGSLVRRALENLLLNAIEFAGQQPPGHVTASLIPRGEQAVLVVDDDGPGVPPEDRDRIFHPYFSSKAGGTGLGLALVKQVFEAHGGSIRCEDSPMGGARFVATLPPEPPGEQP